MMDIKIQGELDVFISQQDDELDGVTSTWSEVLIHGNPEGLKSLAKLLMEIAELNQNNAEDKHLPIGARAHVHLRPGIELSKSSCDVIVGRLDAKGTGVFYDRFISKDSTYS
jgi:hypothetical protein